MITSRSARQAYHATKATTASPRDVEAAILSSINADLRQALDGKMKHPDLCVLLDKNAKIWRHFHSDLNSTGNGLPIDLKQRLLGLADMVFVETDRILRGGAGVGELIAINDAIIAGLRPAMQEVA
ncbi:flagellar biosynthesis regulator FlaF [Pontivivens insulae]|uniref:Flagellar protein FlaF n=1 Tax=Pontivivens insulae TaxID=1639689 RepID=A0A2R8A9D8_9RHOB|nr:flagellar biosynthesis regulator FlaF [Pontivivens insulae]RED12761.1 flagellar protein FlaF [Pontivivens insulae]SPF28852.1 hypothetical protein POI8812_01155 [Pontivivens insulae]